MGALWDSAVPINAVLIRIGAKPKEFFRKKRMQRLRTHGIILDIQQTDSVR